MMEKIRTRVVGTPTKVFQIVGAQDFLKILSTRKSSIESVTFIRPSLGSKKLGRYKVEFENGI